MAVERGMIEPFMDGQIKENASGGRVISYGLSSYGYDLRVSDEFKTSTVGAKKLRPCGWLHMAGKRAKS